MPFGKILVEVRRDALVPEDTEGLPCPLVPQGDLVKSVLIVPAAPHYADQFGVRRIWHGRICKAIALAHHTDQAIIVVGDANGGHDVRTFAALARTAGIEQVFEAFNDPGSKNTRGDMAATARLITSDPIFGDLETITIVSCWYHLPRCAIALRQELGMNISIRLAPVFGQSPPNGLWNELRGCWDYLRQSSQTTRGGHIGKPDVTN